MVVKMKVHDTLRQCKLAVPEAVRHGPICADTGQELDAWHEYLEQVQKERMEEELWLSTGKRSQFNICHACGDRLCLYCHNSTNRGCEKCPESKGARNVPSRKPLWSDEDEMAELYKYDYVDEHGSLLSEKNSHDDRRYDALGVTSWWDADSGASEHVGSVGACERCFLGQGILSNCKHCGSIIECGILYCGLRIITVWDWYSQKNVEGRRIRLKVGTGTREEIMLVFERWNQRNGGDWGRPVNVKPRQWDSDWKEVSFHHWNGTCAPGIPFPGRVSRQWETALGQCQQKVPGSNMGVSLEAYTALLHETGVTADFMLNSVHVTQTGKFWKSKAQPKVSDKPSSTPCSDLPVCGYLKRKWQCDRYKVTTPLTDSDGDSNDTKSDGDSDRNSDNKSDGDSDKDKAMLEKSIYPIKRWRVRATPIVQEPEWQYDDNDVAAAWRHVLPEVLDAVQPHEFYATAAASVKALGHWPVAHKSVGNVVQRAETRLAVILRAWVWRPSSVSNFFSRAIYTARLAHMKRSMQQLSDSASEHVTEAWAYETEAALRRIGLTIAGVDAKKVFYRVPARRLGFKQQKAKLERLGIYHALEIGYELVPDWWRTTAVPPEDVRWQLTEKGWRQEVPVFVPRSYMVSPRSHSDAQSKAVLVRPADVIGLGFDCADPRFVCRLCEEDLCRDLHKRDPWGPLFTFDDEFRQYNEKGMRAQDPQSHRWCGDKQFFDYTLHVTREDWLWRFRVERRFEQVTLREARKKDCDDVHQEFARDWKRFWGKYPDKYEIALELRRRKSFCRGCYDNESDERARRKMLHLDGFWFEEPPSKFIWDAFRDLDDPCCDSHPGPQAESDRAPFGKFLLNHFLVGDEAYFDDRETNSLQPGGPREPHKLFWIGGTYARHPSLFPTEQGETIWIHKHLRPLAIQPSHFLLSLRRMKIMRKLNDVVRSAKLKDHVKRHDMPAIWFGCDNPRLSWGEHYIEVLDRTWGGGPWPLRESQPSWWVSARASAELTEHDMT